MRYVPRLHTGRAWLDTLVIVFAVTVAICGLVAVGLVIVLGVGLARFGDNK